MSQVQKTVFLRNAQQGHGAILLMWDHCKPWLIAGHELMLRVTQILKKREQEEKYHAMIGDIARQVQHVGRYWDADDMKRFLVDEFAEEMRAIGQPLHHDSRVFPSLDGRRIVQLGIQTREFWVSEASAFIEYLYAKGAETGVQWTEPKRQSTN